MILLITFAIAVLAALLYVIGIAIGDTTIERLGHGISAGALSAMMAEIIVLSLELSDAIGFGAFFLLCLIFFFLYRTGGPGVLYTAAMFVIMFGYLFTGPYSGYLKTYTEKVTEPMGIAVSQLGLVGNDLWLIATDPQGYIEKAEKTAVRSETPTISYPMGVEFKNIEVMPRDVPANQSFYVRVYAMNEGKMTASVVVRASCANKLCCMGSSCGVSEETIQYYPSLTDPKILQPREAINFRFENPFKAVTYKKTDVGKEAQVNVSLHYAHSTSSRLTVKVMDNLEVQRIMTDPVAGETLFKPEVSVGKNAPGMLALTVGYQPLFENSPNVLIVSIVNKRPKGDVIVDEKTTIDISVDPSIGNGLDCSANEDFYCSSNDGYNVTCTVTRSGGIAPIGPGKYRPITCTFRAVEDVPTSVTGLITARMSDYTFQLMEKKGAKITMAWSPASPAQSQETGEEPGLSDTGVSPSCPEVCCSGRTTVIRNARLLTEQEKTTPGTYICSSYPDCGCLDSEHPGECTSECVTGYLCREGTCYAE